MEEYEESLNNFGLETASMRTCWDPKCRWKGNIKMGHRSLVWVFGPDLDI